VRSLKQAAEALERLAEHLRANEVDLAETPMALGPWLTLDGETEMIVSVDGIEGAGGLEEANRLAHGSYREPFIVPENV
jgi:hypothetical protein